MTTYKFSRRIGRGGMAEVFLALQEGLGGFEKLVVVKRIFPHFCEDRHFVKMFFDEARLAASVRHPNVVEILDVCRDERGLFIVMEYLSGETLGFMHERLRARGDGRFPFQVACRIAADVAAGLHSAHTATDEEGRLRGIVHRDVTPSNLLVGYSGLTKVLDFGVAKAKVERGDSDPGTLKGKIGYLAPELLEGDRIDLRADVFQLGVVLHEMLTGKTLFKAENDHKTMVAVLDREIPPPSTINPGVPEELDRIVLAATQRKLGKRTQSADKLRRELEAFLRSHDNVSQNDLGDWLRTTFTDRYQERLALERECIQDIKKGRPASEVPVMTAPFAPTAPFEPITGQTAVTVLEIPSRPGVTRMTARRRRRRWRALGFAAAGAAVLAVGVYLSARNPEAAAHEAARAEPAVEPPNVEPPDVEPPDVEVAEATVAAEEPPAEAVDPAESSPERATKVTPSGQNERRSRPVGTTAEPEPVMPTATEPTLPTESVPESPRRGPKTDNRDPWADE